MDGVLTAELVLDDFAYPTPEDRRIFFQQVERRLAGSPTVAAFSFGSAMPGDGTSDARVALDGQQPDADRDWPSVQRRVVSPSFFSMFGMRTVAGRTFGPGDPDPARHPWVGPSWSGNEARTPSCTRSSAWSRTRV